MLVAKDPTDASAASTMIRADIADDAGNGGASVPMFWIVIARPFGCLFI